MNIEQIIENKVNQKGSIFYKGKIYINIDDMLKDYNSPYCRKRFNTLQDYCKQYNVEGLTSESLVNLKHDCIIINSTGYYKTRKGSIVRIYEIKDQKCSNCYGYTQKKKKGKLIDKEWSTWNMYGYFTFVGNDHPLDIIEKVK